MTGRTHLLAGAVSAVAFLTFQCVDAFGPRGVAAAVGGACLGALLPDVDCPRSLLGRGAGPVGAVPGLVLRHRGPAHSLAAALAAGVGVSWLCGACWFAPVGGFAVFLGCLSHLLLDALTPGGVPLLWPLWGGRIGVPLVRVGSAVERVLRLAFLGVLVVLALCGPVAWVVWNWLWLWP